MLRVLILGIFLAHAGRLEAQKSSWIDDMAPNMECQNLLDNPPLSQLDQYVPQGRGSAVGDHSFGKALIGVRCAPEQIIAYMENEGFNYLGIETWPEPIGPSFAPLNVRLSFCAPPTTFLNKILGHNCEVVAYFHLLNGQITRIPSAALK